MKKKFLFLIILSFFSLLLSIIINSTLTNVNFKVKFNNFKLHEKKMFRDLDICDEEIYPFKINYFFEPDNFIDEYQLTLPKKTFNEILDQMHQEKLILSNNIKFLSIMNLINIDYNKKIDFFYNIFDSYPEYGVLNYISTIENRKTELTKSFFIPFNLDYLLLQNEYYKLCNINFEIKELKERDFLTLFLYTISFFIFFYVFFNLLYSANFIKTRIDRGK